MNMFPIRNKELSHADVHLMGTFVMVLVKMRLCHRYNGIADIRPLDFAGWQRSVLNEVINIKGTENWYGSK